MAKKLWNVHGGSEHEGSTVDHVYESPKDAIKVARRYASKLRSYDPPDDGRPVWNAKIGKNARMYDPQNGLDAVVVTPVNVRSKNFAFRK